VRQSHSRHREDADGEHARTAEQPPRAVPTSVGAILAMQRTAGNAAVSRAILQRQFTVTKPNIGKLQPMIGGIPYTNFLPRNYRAELVTQYGEDKVKRLEAWARSAHDLGGGQPFPTWDEAIQASEKQGAPPDAASLDNPTPTTAPTSVPAKTTPQIPTNTAPQIPSIKPPHQAEPSPEFGIPSSPKLPIYGMAAVLAKYLPETHACCLQTTDVVEFFNGGLVKLNHGVTAVVEFFAEMLPKDFNNLLIWSRDPKTNSELVRGLAASATYRLRVEANFVQALQNLSTLVKPAQLLQPPFALMTLADLVRLYDIVNGAKYLGVLKMPTLPALAAEFALNPAPATVHEFVSRWSYFVQASEHLGLIEEGNESKEKSPEGEGKAASKLKPGAVDTMLSFRSAITAGAKQAGIVKTHVLKLWQPLHTFNVDKLGELICEAAKDGKLGFGSPDSAVDHVLKHVKRTEDVKGISKDTDKLAEIAKDYLKEAWAAIVAGEIETSTLSQDGAIRSFKFKSALGDVVVIVAQDGSVRIATYIAEHRL